MGANKLINRIFPLLSQQAPLVSRVHLMKIVRKIGKNEQSKGKHLTDCMFKEPHLGDGKDMTSLLLPGQKADERNTQSSIMFKGTNSLEIGLCNRKYQSVNDKYAVKHAKAEKNEREAEFEHPGSTNCPFLSDIIVASSNSDDTLRDVKVNTLIARKHYVPRKRSLMHSGGSFKSLLRVCSRAFTFIALLLAIVISVLGGFFNIRLAKRKKRRWHLG